jgi:hypothetical protein
MRLMRCCGCVGDRRASRVSLARCSAAAIAAPHRRSLEIDPMVGIKVQVWAASRIRYMLGAVTIERCCPSWQLRDDLATPSDGSSPSEILADVLVLAANQGGLTGRPVL